MKLYINIAVINIAVINIAVINIAVIKVAVFVCAVLFVVCMDFVMVFAVIDFQRHGGIVVWLFWIWGLKIDLLIGCWWRPVVLLGV